jgi:hypothetical protein
MPAAPDSSSAVFSSNARCTIALVTSLQALRRKDIGPEDDSACVTGDARRARCP